MKSVDGLFIFFAFAIVFIAVLFFLIPLLNRHRGTSASQRNIHNLANIDLLREELMELAKEHKEGLLSDADFDQASNELKRRLLDESEKNITSAEVKASSPALKTALLVSVFVPLFSVIFYSVIGTPLALDPENTKPRHASSEFGAQDIEGMVSKLAKRLEESPDDLTGWIMLARSYKVLQQLDEARKAYVNVIRLNDSDPKLLAEYAEIIYWTENRLWTDEAKTLLQKALTIDPRSYEALLFSGSAAYEEGDCINAREYWQRLSSLAEPGSEEQAELKRSIDEALTQCKPNTQ